MNIIYHFRVKGVGPERVHISGIAGAFEKLGHVVSFVSPTGINPLKTGDITPQRGFIRSIIYFLVDKMPQVGFECMEILYNVIAYIKIKGQISTAKPQLIYERYSFFCCAGVFLSKINKIPFIIEVNEVCGFDRVRPQKLVALSKYFEKYIFKNADVIVTVSEFLKNEVIQRGGRRESILVVPNGIDTELFLQRPSSNSFNVKLDFSGCKVIGFVGYLIHWHRLDMLLEVFANIQTKYPNTKLLLVGDGVLRNDLEILAKSLSIESHLIITGRVDHTDIPSYINLMDIAIIPNSNDYRSPIKLFEYMAMAKAIVAPDLPPILGILEDATTGLIFKNGDSNDLLNKIEMALNDHELCQNVGRKAQHLVVDKYTWDIHAANILCFLDKSPKYHD